MPAPRQTDLRVGELLVEPARRRAALGGEPLALLVGGTVLMLTAVPAGAGRDLPVRVAGQHLRDHHHDEDHEDARRHQESR